MKKNICKICITTMLGVCIFTTNVYANDTEQHRVDEGDTLWKISRKYDVKLGDVIQSNPQIANPDLIYPNDIVQVPGENKEPADGSIGASMCDFGNGATQTNPEIKMGSNAGQTAQTSSNATESEVANLVNQERAKQGLAPLTLSADISNVARIKSEDMRDAHYFDHTSLRYGSPFEMLKSFGINYKTAGENIAKGQKTAASVMDAWMHSEGHRKNIMNPDFKEIGIGYVKDSSGSTYWTQQFVTR